jgi:hypothetical protein
MLNAMLSLPAVVAHSSLLQINRDGACFSFAGVLKRVSYRITPNGFPGRGSVVFRLPSG